MSSLQHSVNTYLAEHAPHALAFWTEEGSGGDAGIDVLSACDALYTLKLIGCMDLVSPGAHGRFADLLSRTTLAGNLGNGQGPEIGVHQTAYALGVLNLLKAHGISSHREILRKSGWRVQDLVDRKTGRPRWPWYFAHHSWRVGHWIGGIPSIVLSLWRLSPDLAQKNRLPRPRALLALSDALIDNETGLLRVYRAPALQQIFRLLYKLRHDPDAGAIGGVAHLHWGNYAAGRLPYKAAHALFERAWRLLQRRPFMEAQPYCLDFDIVQIARTAMPEGDTRRAELRSRATAYTTDLAEFYGNGLGGSYSLHKLPGGLAALHESAMAANFSHVPGLSIVPVDVAREAHWI